MTVKSLLVKIGADTKELESKLGKANTSIQKHSEQFKKVGRVAAVAGAAIVGALGMMIRGYVSAGDEVHKMALRTGFSTEALSELKYAAEISGTSLGSLGKGIKKMASSIGEAKLGLKTYTDAFKLINIEVQELEGLSPEEQFFKMADGIAAIEDPTQRAYAAQKLLGRAGTELLPLFAEGAEGMANLRQKARDMGIVFDQEAADKAAKLNDSLTTLKGSFKGASNSIAEILVPAITGLVDKIAGIVIKVKDWIKENPVLAGVLVKVAGAVGIILGVLGPLLMFLPALSAGFTILWGAIMGPVGIVIGAVAAVAAAAYLIYKNWEPIKDFFSGLWKSVTGFFVNAFNSIKKKMIGWAEAIVGVLEKIPLVKKVVGPWKESLQKMREEMDETARNVSEAAASIEADSIATGRAFLEAVKGTTLFKDAAAAVEGKTGLLNKVLAVTKVGLTALGKGFEKAGGSSEKMANKNTEAAKKIAAANKKIIGMTKTMTNKIKKATLSEYKYSKEMLEQKLADQLTSIEETEANEDTKNTAIAAAREAFRLEDEALDIANKAKEAARQEELTTKMITVWKDFYAAVKAKQEEFKTASKAATDQLNQLTLDEYTYKMTVLDDKYGAEQDYWKKVIAETGSGQDELMKVTRAHQIEIDKIKEDAAIAEMERIEDEKNARKQALQDTLGEISSVLNTIGGLFQGSFNLKMDLIDQEENKRIESINAQYDAQIAAMENILSAEQEKTKEVIDAINSEYDAQIAALKGISEAEQEKTKEVLKSINDEYDKKKQYILDNVKDEDKRVELLRVLEVKHEKDLEEARARRKIAEEQAAADTKKLEEEHAADLEQAIIDREKAEQEAADAIIAIEDAKNEALRLASEELEKKRRKARRQAAKQEKAVALLSAIVNTAAAVAKALPNIILSVAVGILGAAQIAIIAATPLPPLREGGIVMQPTAVLAGEAGPEAIIPLNKIGSLMPAPIAFNMYVKFFGDINNVGDMDAISDRLGNKVRRAIERGR